MDRKQGMRKQIRAWPVLALAILSTGCLGRFEEPQVRLDGIRLGSVGLRGGLLYAELSVANPNDFQLETQNLSYEIEVAQEPDGGSWLRLASGLHEDAVVVGARDSTRLEVPVEFSFDELGGVARSLLGRGVVDYRVSGVIDLLQPIRRTVPYRRIGKMSLDAVR
jgi:LEA14-like dessication related protein